MKKVQRHILLLMVATVIGLTSCKQGGEHQILEKPNIIMVLADDLGYGDLSSFNETGGIQTTHLDAMAAEGMRFTDAHTSSSVCTPTRYGLMTGRYNWRTQLKKGVLSGTSKALIPEDRTTIASFLQKSGYHTAFIGKWHLGWDWAINSHEGDEAGEWEFNGIDIDFSAPLSHGPNTLGFDYAYGHSGSLDMAPYVYVENGRVTAQPDRITTSEDPLGWWREGPTGSDFIHEEVSPNFFERSMEYIRQRASQEQAFFLYLALPSPHTPILPLEAWKGKSGLNPYGDFVLMIDDYMGQLFEVISSAGIEENTLVVFTSDNGCSPAAKIDQLMEKGHNPSYIFRGHKADIYEGGHRVPFIIKWPAVIAPGQVCEEIICTTDLFRTFASITAYEVGEDEGEDSYDLTPLLSQPSMEESLREATVHHSINGSFAIRQGPWKLIMCPGSGGWSYPTPGEVKDMKKLPPIQLYNLSDDPAETTNLEADYPHKVLELKTLLSCYIREGRSTKGNTQANDSIDFTWPQIWFTE